MQKQKKRPSAYLIGKTKRLEEENGSGDGTVEEYRTKRPRAKKPRMGAKEQSRN